MNVLETLKLHFFLVLSPLPSFLPTLAIPSYPYPRYVGRPLRSLTFGGSGGIFFSTLLRNWRDEGEDEDAVEDEDEAESGDE